MKMMGSDQGLKGQVRLVSGLLFATLVWGCGSRVSSGNTGSETHWLQSCERDADCGTYSCYCGVCSRGCDEDNDCDEVPNITSHCAESNAVSQCSEGVPARVCAQGAGPTSSTDTGEQSSSNSTSVDGTSTNTGDDTSTNTGDDTEPPPGPVICDGSDEVRFVYQTSGGFVPGYYAFTGRYGASFLAIDGNCNFWGASSPGEVVTGTISNEALLEDYQSSEFGRLGRYDDLDSYAPPCSDASATLVWDPSGSASGFLCGVPEELSELAETLGKANALANNVNGQGVRSDGPLRLLILRGLEGSAAAVQWPLDLDPSVMVPAQPLTYDELGAPLAGIQFEAGYRAGALRGAMMSDDTTVFEYGSSPPVQFEAVLRDDVPPKVLAALELARLQSGSKQNVSLGQECSAPETCTEGLTCRERTAEAGGGTACNTCVKPDDPTWLCRSNDDCCGDLVCCVDCGDKSGTCIAEPEPCETCVENGSRWVFPNTCDPEQCVPDSSCYAESCPGACTSENCGGCGREQECWAAGCSWSTASEHFYCDTSVIPVPTPEPCEVTITDESLPGVSVHLEADTCAVFAGEGAQFRYRVELTQPLDFTTESSEGSCGLCGDASDPETWTRFSITGGEHVYCPECDVGCCPPTDAVETLLETQTIEGTIDWPGLEWNGPSDTGAEPAGEFSPGDYAATLTVSLPGVGEVSATLPILVRPFLVP